MTARELEVLRAWVRADFDSAGAAGILGCSDSAVRQHIRSIQTRTGIHTRRGLEAFLGRAGKRAAPEMASIWGD